MCHLQHEFSVRMKFDGLASRSCWEGRAQLLSAIAQFVEHQVALSAGKALAGHAAMRGWGGGGGDALDRKPGRVDFLCSGRLSTRIGAVFPVSLH